jgi:hypothetical protein
MVTLQGLTEAIHLLSLPALLRVEAVVDLERQELSRAMAAATEEQLSEPDPTILIGLAAEARVVTLATAVMAQ